ncbi:MAG: TIGR04076 family protein, partial [Megasphaera micronuciformis]|nr:TIGR04076 family protein [Megasphaera micronuciformis]
MKKKDVKITIIDSLGPKGCHRGHRVGDTFSYDKDRGRICPM